MVQHVETTMSNMRLCKTIWLPCLTIVCQLNYSLLYCIVSFLLLDIAGRTRPFTE